MIQDTNMSFRAHSDSLHLYSPSRLPLLDLPLPSPADGRVGPILASRPADILESDVERNPGTFLCEAKRK
jgi:hypothetical protein